MIIGISDSHTAFADGQTVVIGSALSGAAPWSKLDHDQTVDLCMFSPSGTRLLSKSQTQDQSCMVYIWSVRTRTCCVKRRVPKTTLCALNETTVFIVQNLGVVLLDIQTLERRHQIPVLVADMPVTWISCRDNRTLVISNHKRIQVWSLQTMACVREFTSDAGPCILSRDETLAANLFLGDRHSYCRCLVREVSTGETLMLLLDDSRFCDFFPDNLLFVTADCHHIFEPRSGTRLFSFARASNCCALAPNGTRLAAYHLAAYHHLARLIVIDMPDAAGKMLALCIMRPDFLPSHVAPFCV